MVRGLTEKELAALVADFRRWGQKTVERIRRLTWKYGVLCSANVFSNGKKG